MLCAGLTHCPALSRVTQTRSFDTEAASSSYATGFVVDKVRGLILTNRHVVTPGELPCQVLCPTELKLHLRHLWCPTRTSLFDKVIDNVGRITWRVCTVYDKNSKPPQREPLLQPSSTSCSIALQVL